MYWKEDEEDIAEEDHLKQQDARANTVLEEGKLFNQMTDSALKRLRSVLTGSSVVEEVNVKGCETLVTNMDRLKPGV